MNILIVLFLVPLHISQLLKELPFSCCQQLNSVCLNVFQFQAELFNEQVQSYAFSLFIAHSQQDEECRCPTCKNVKRRY